MSRPYRWRHRVYKTVRGLSTAMREQTGAMPQRIHGGFLYAQHPNGNVDRYYVTQRIGDTIIATNPEATFVGVAA